ncbi:hypothetical protein [Polaribacter sp. Q13]|uniref:hypothetical protein n=1 Tax=Polaribacter sp. Q13 TaxID=2806551 RepID=UPI00193B2039|nr:hypothetical protein [Polaribacter sp. Q13]QVY65626.1 hypothetical protein JOP69_18145 [Polaribacter sp. Q13]
MGNSINYYKKISDFNIAIICGNASSEMRVCLNKVNNIKGKREREILLLVRFKKKQEPFPVFDSVLYDFVVRESNLILMLNT